MGDRPTPPWPVGPRNAHNAKREGWKSFFDDKPRKSPFPPARADLRAGFEEGWDAARDWHNRVNWDKPERQNHG